MSSSTDSQVPSPAGIGGGDLQLPRPPGLGRVRGFWTRHERLADILLALFFALIAYTAAADTKSAGLHRLELSAPALPFILIAAGGLLARRRHPTIALGCSAAVIVCAAWAPSSLVLAPVLLGIYSLAVYGTARATWVTAGVVEVVATVAIAIQIHRGSNRGALAVDYLGSVIEFAALFAAFVLAAALLGINIAGRRRYHAALVERAHQLARERDQQAELAAAAERARIAREMHDIVSHSLTVIVALAEGTTIALQDTNPTATQAVHDISDTGRTALTEMRRMLGVLGADPDDQTRLAPQPRVTDLWHTADQFRAAGLPLDLAINGTVPDDPDIQLAVYRIVQEALTNALRYADRPTTVTAHIDASTDPITIAVTDNGRHRATPPPSIGSGRGLLGLAQRANTLAGTIAAGPRTDGQLGWRVTATIPTQQTGEEPNR